MTPKKRQRPNDSANASTPFSIPTDQSQKTTLLKNHIDIALLRKIEIFYNNKKIDEADSLIDVFVKETFIGENVVKMAASDIYTLNRYGKRQYRSQLSNWISDSKDKFA